MKRNYFGKCLPVFVMVCIVFCFVFYGVRVDASAPDAGTIIFYTKITRWEPFLMQKEM